MARIHNQFIIKISNSTQWCDYQELIEACSSLNGAALKLYIYFCSFMAGEEINFFPKNFCELFNVSLTSEKNAFNELIRENYLKNLGKDLYEFSSIKN